MAWLHDLAFLSSLRLATDGHAASLRPVDPRARMAGRIVTGRMVIGDDLRHWAIAGDRAVASAVAAMAAVRFCADRWLFDRLEQWHEQPMEEHTRNIALLQDAVNHIEIATEATSEAHTLIRALCQDVVFAGGAPVGVDVLLGYITRVITTVSRQIINSRRRADRSLWQLNTRLQAQRAYEESARWTTLNMLMRQVDEFEQEVFFVANRARRALFQVVPAVADIERWA